MPAQRAEKSKFQVDLSIATEPNNIGEVPKLLKEISEEFDTAVNSSVRRKGLLVKCRNLVQALETPRETMINHCWAQTGAIAGLNFGVSSGLWIQMAQHGDQPQKVADLAANLEIDPVLLSRLMRHLGAMGYLIEAGEGEYRLTNYTKAMSIPAISSGYLAMLSCTSAGAMRFHEFSRKRGWMNPDKANDTAMMYAYGTNMGVFEWQRFLGYDTHFSDHMAGYKLGSLPWMAPGFYPVEQRLIKAADPNPEASFLVDIGGNVGYDIAQFHRFFPEFPGKLILQDLPVVISQIQDLDPSIVRMEYDFHTEQPIKGARAYYMHNCLHNWPDDACDSILAQIKAAMRPGYSKLLIHEHVVPEAGAYWEDTALDMVMLTLLSAQQRTRAAWYNLIETRVGLSIVKIWSDGQGSQSLIECELFKDGE